MKRIILYIAALQMLCIPHYVSANVGFFIGAGQTIVPVQSENLAMTKEEVQFNILYDKKEKLFTSKNYVPGVRVECRFHVKNLSNKRIQGTLGFPFATSLEKTPIEKFQVIENDRKVSKILIDTRKAAHGRETLFYWKSKFRPNEEKIIQVNYTQKFSYYGLYSETPKGLPEKYKRYYKVFRGAAACFYYMTSTVKTWAGNVESAKFRIALNDFPDSRSRGNESGRGMDKPFTYCVTYANPKQFTFDSAKRTFELNAADFDGSENIFFNHLIMFLPGNKKEAARFLQEHKPGREVCTVLRNFYEAVNGRIFSGDMQEFFKNFTWYSPNKNYSVDAIPQRDYEIIQEFDSYLNK